MSTGPESVAGIEAGRADGVFEGGGVRGIAFAGALAAAEEVGGVREWVSVAGTSAGAIAAALLACGYRGEALRDVLLETDYRRLRDYGPGGRLVGGLVNSLHRRGYARGDAVRDWLAERFAASPMGKPAPTFADVARRVEELPADLTGDERERARYRLRVVASDVTAGEMVVFPDDLGRYSDEHGEPHRPERFPLVEAVRASIALPFLFEPVVLHRDGRPHHLVDGGLLSNFPVWLFDAPRPRRPTWGFRLVAGEGPERPPHRRLPLPFWQVPLLWAMFRASMEAWDRRHRSRTTAVRTVTIPTGAVAADDFGLSRAQKRELYARGYAAASAFFEQRVVDGYRNELGAGL